MINILEKVYYRNKIRIYPNKETKRRFEECFHYRRACFNRGMELYNEGVAIYGYYSLRDIVKKDRRKDYDDNYTSQIMDNALFDLYLGFKKFYKGMGGKPNFISRESRKHPKSFRISRKNDNAIRIMGKYLKLVTLPRVKLSHLPYIDGIIKQCTISREEDRYYATFDIEADKANHSVRVKSFNAIGIDVGIKNFATVSKYNTGTKDFTIAYYHMPYKTSSYVMKLYNRIDDYNRILSRKVRGSNRYEKVRTKLNNTYKRITRINNDYQHKITTNLCKTFDLIVIEDFSVTDTIRDLPWKKARRNLYRNRIFEFQKQLYYKSIKYGCELVILDRDEPTTQTCCICGYVRTGDEKLTLKDRVYRCPNCGNKMERDANAASVILTKGIKKLDEV